MDAACYSRDFCVSRAPWRSEQEGGRSNPSISKRGVFCSLSRSMNNLSGDDIVSPGLRCSTGVVLYGFLLIRMASCDLAKVMFDHYYRIRGTLHEVKVACSQRLTPPTSVNPGEANDCLVLMIMRLCKRCQLTFNCQSGHYRSPGGD